MAARQTALSRMLKCVFESEGNLRFSAETLPVPVRGAQKFKPPVPSSELFINLYFMKTFYYLRTF